MFSVSFLYSESWPKNHSEASLFIECTIGDHGYQFLAFFSHSQKKYSEKVCFDSQKILDCDIEHREYYLSVIR